MGEVDITPHEHEDFQMSPEAKRLVPRLLRGEKFARNDPGMPDLIRLRLAVPEPFTGKYVLDDLRHVQRVFIAEEQQGIAHHQHRLTAITRFFAGLEQAAAEGGSGIEYFDSQERVNSVIARHMSSLRSRLYTAHPDERKPDSLKRSVGREVDILGRGVAMRTIYPDSARGRAAEREWAKTVSTHGAEVRTLAIDFIRMLLLDDRCAIVSDHRTHPLKLGTGYIVTHPGMVALLGSVYQQQWDRADPWMGERSRPDTGTVTTSRSREILRRLEREQTLKQIANGIGLSLATVNKEMTALYENTGTKSHFTLGQWWAASDERKLP